MIYSIRDSRVLNWKKRNIVKSKWSNDTTFTELYNIDSDTITTMNQLVENPCSIKNVKEHFQYQHGGVSGYGEKFTTGVVYRVVNSEHSYDIDNDAMVDEYIPVVNHINNGMIGFDYVRFHEFLQTLVDKQVF